LAQGEYISPERLENIYASTSGIATIFIHGDSTQTSLVGIICPDPEPFSAFASKVLRRHIPASELESVYADLVLKKALLKEFDRLAERRNLQGFEKIRGVHIATEPFTVENGLLTPTLKLKRADAARAFRKVIDRLYAEINAKNVQVKSKL
jgi:long-chain acyl-CoA synthetase